MRTLVFDGRTGAAGDMICAALIATGADPAVLAPVTDRLPVRYEVDETTKNGIRATTVDVLLRESGDGGGDNAEPATKSDRSHAHGHDHSHDQGHEHDHDHSHDQGHEHEHGHHEHEHAEGAGVHRSYPEVVALVRSMDLSDPVESVALDAFERLGRAEASIHGTDLEGTHFHEVGADDAIADVVGAALLLDDLDPDRIVTTPVATGGGDVEMSHGVYPVPAPATTEIVAGADFSVVGGPVDRELLTPTGAAILAAVAEGVDRLPALDVDASGYGAGDATFPDRPNVLRALVGDGGEGVADDATEPGDGLVWDDIAVLETNLDDASPEVLGGLQETLSRAGARDVTVVPTTMKKSRPGHLVKAICKPADAEAVAERLARETGTLGVRQSGANHRWIAERAFETATIAVDGDEHEVSVKVASTADGDVYDVSAEYDEAAAVSEATGLPIRDVLRRAEARVRESIGE
ncbi:nickel pincer cofactor biosynthesis protein LarC [Halorubrum sp. AD140]|uniref:nickel pincer cofactor biosynthesis protein LarC n=1 Tax=Halorubrum sp. AD140 TaxID=3050073 RepID=UPI002ACC6ECD|nr:nickel pincer cofactor biosynthesis protein LarC [Halorubrum sp. AD140]MDZ5809798.1 nickel pincer cofactor biosynthesis protein LarC [Halorubrum sp. AD140]